MRALISLLRNTKHIGLNTVYSIEQKKIKRSFPKIHSEFETVEKIIQSGYSASRYGDGEFRWMSGMKNNSFQHLDQKMARRLRQILNSKTKNVLICIPGNLIGQQGYVTSNSLAWKKLLVKNWIGWSGLFETPERSYFDANFTRPYIDRKDKNGAEQRFNHLKQIWAQKKVLIVEGEKTRFGIGNDLLSGCEEVKRIICPATNAFDVYDEILDSVGRHIDGFDVALVALGPTATVLVYDLTEKFGLQAIDIGHTDIEYEWFLSKSKVRGPVAGKFVNETTNKFVGGLSAEDIQKYKNEIISVVG